MYLPATKSDQVDLYYEKIWSHLLINFHILTEIVLTFGKRKNRPHFKSCRKGQGNLLMVLSNFILTVVGCYIKSCVYYFLRLVRLASNYQTPSIMMKKVSIMLRISMAKTVGECFTVLFE